LLRVGTEVYTTEDVGQAAAAHSDQDDIHSHTLLKISDKTLKKEKTVTPREGRSRHHSTVTKRH
jgi:hypothetical protein